MSTGLFSIKIFNADGQEKHITVGSSDVVSMQAVRGQSFYLTSIMNGAETNLAALINGDNVIIG